MATGYVVTGRGDLDGLFQPRLGTAIANTNFRSNGGVDLAQRFETRGTNTAIAATGFRAGASDLAQLFLGLGAASDPVLITRTMVPGSLGGPSFDVTWRNTASGYALVSGSSMSATPEWTKGGQLYRLDEFQKDGLTANFNIIRISHATTQPANNDNVWQFMRLTGVFSNSSGATVARTLARSVVSTVNNYTSPSGRPGFSWQPGTPLFQMIAGNSYTLEIG